MPTVRDVLYLSGDVFLPKGVRKVLEEYHLGNSRSIVYVTNWSLLHLISGLIIGYILRVYYPEYPYYWTGFGIHTVWEIWQILVKNTPYWTARGILDVGMDTALFMGGLSFAAWAIPL